MNGAVYAIAALDVLLGQMRARRISKAEQVQRLSEIEQMIESGREPTSEEIEALWADSVSKTEELERLVAAKLERL